MIPIKIPTGFFVEIDKLNLKFIQKFKGVKIAKTISKKQNKKSEVGGLTCPDFKTYKKPIVIKTRWYWQKYRHTDEYNST